MDEQYQIEIPQSFMALYVRNGRPIETRRHIEERYDLCEDMAVQTSDLCHALQFAKESSEADILGQCFVALRDGGVVTEAEATWVIARTAELLQWQRPDAATPPAR